MIKGNEMIKHQFLWLCAVIISAPQLPPPAAAFLSTVCILMAVYFEWKSK